MTEPTRRRLLAGGTAALLGLPALARAAAPAQKGETVRWPTVRRLDGPPLGEPELQGRARVVVFFSTTCPFCVRHNAHVQKLHEATRQLPMTVLAAALDDDPAAVRRYLAAHRYTFDVTLDHRPLREVLSERA
ncbi:MAG: redoxin domain-containing protein [Rhizobacter sp.]|nr:redoxin domain-containing protein [Rhizobacter sp.]